MPAVESGGVVDSTVARCVARASRLRIAVHGIEADIVCGRKATSGASTERVPVVGLGHWIVAVSCTTGRNGNTSASAAPSPPSSTASQRVRHSARFSSAGDGSVVVAGPCAPFSAAPPAVSGSAVAVSVASWPDVSTWCVLACGG